MVKQLHTDTLRPIVRGVIAQNAMPRAVRGSAPSTRREIVTALLQSSCSAKGVVAGGFADAAEVVKHRGGQLNQRWRGVIHGTSRGVDPAA